MREGPERCRWIREESAFVCLPRFSRSPSSRSSCSRSCLSVSRCSSEDGRHPVGFSLEKGLGGGWDPAVPGGEDEDSSGSAASRLPAHPWIHPPSTDGRGRHGGTGTWSVPGAQGTDFGGAGIPVGAVSGGSVGVFPCTLYRRSLFNDGKREPLPEPAESREGWAPTDRGLGGDTNLENGASSSCVFPEFCVSAAGKTAAPSGLCFRLGTGRFGLFPQRFSRSFPSLFRLR